MNAAQTTPKEFAALFVAQLFAGRKGHGGGPCLKRNLTSPQLVEIVEAAYRAGVSEGHRIARTQNAK